LVKKEKKKSSHFVYSTIDNYWCEGNRRRHF
jgi:hypothetical protein